MSAVEVRETVTVGTSETEIAVFGGSDRTGFYVRNNGPGSLTDFKIQARMADEADWEEALSATADFSTASSFLLVTTSLNDPNALTTGQQYQATFDLSLVRQIRVLATADADASVDLVAHI